MTQALKEHLWYLGDTSQIKNVHKNISQKYFHLRRKIIV